MKKQGFQNAQMRRGTSLFKMSVAISLLCAATTIASAQMFKTLADFNTTNAYEPYQQALVQGTDGNLYGTTLLGGKNDQGTVFKTTPNGVITTIYSFCSQPNCVDGEEPFAGLVLGTDGNFYGTTFYGGSSAEGTVFKITSAGLLTTLHSFSGSDGANPQGALVQGADGSYYGTTSTAGANQGGTIFKITAARAFTTIYNFCSSTCTDGQYPRAGMIQASNGLFYGTTIIGGAFSAGTVFSVTSTGVLTTLFSFNETDGYTPYGPLVEVGGNFYGTTALGGGSGCSAGCGTVFEFTPPETLTTLHTFDGTDGESAFAGLVLGTDGNLYGTTEGGGTNSSGTIFQITTAGALTTLYNFCSQVQCIDGGGPFGGLLQDTSGSFYGTTGYGPGSGGAGTLYGLSMALGPFVKFLPASGKVGAEVGILGTKLTGATSVTFNGTPAQILKNSATLILTRVPAGATTGNVQVTVPGKTLASNVAFTVVP